MKAKELFYKKSLKNPCAVTLGLWFLGEWMTKECKNRISELLMEQEITFEKKPQRPLNAIRETFLLNARNAVCPHKLTATWNKQRKENENDQPKS